MTICRCALPLFLSQVIFLPAMSRILRTNFQPIRLRGGAKDWSMTEINEGLEKLNVEISERVEKVRAINASVAERWEALQRKFNEEAEHLANVGHVDPEEMDGDFLPGIVEMLHEEPFGLTRRNYTEENPFVNPCKETREFMDWLSKRSYKEVYDDVKANIERR